MTKNKKLVKKVGCGLLVGAMAFSGITPYSVPVKVEASSPGLKEQTSSMNLAGDKLAFTYERISKYTGYSGLPGNLVPYSITYVQQNKTLTDSDGNTWSYDIANFMYGGPNGQYGQHNIKVAIGLKYIGSKDLGKSEVALPDYVSANIDGVTTKLPFVEIAEGAFTGCSLEVVTIPETYVKISDCAFKDATALQEVKFIEKDSNGNIIGNFGSNIGAIGDYAFSGCTSLKYAYLPESLIEAAVDTNGDFVTSTALGLNQGTNSKFGVGVYRDCKSLTSVKVGTENNTNVWLPYNTFAGCQNLSNIEFSKSIKKLLIGQSALAGIKIQKLSFDCDLVLGSYAFSNISSLRTVEFNGKMELAPDMNDVKAHHIFAESFGSESGIIKSVKFGSGVADEVTNILTIPSNCFENTGGLTSIIFPDDISLDINSFAFANTGVQKLEFTGKDVTVRTNGLGNLGSEVKEVLFSNTGSTNIYTESFAMIDRLSTTVAAIVNLDLNKITINSEKVNYMHTYANQGTQQADIFYGVGSQCSLIFGKNVKEISGTMKDYKPTDNSTITYPKRNGMGDIKNVYITSPNTDIATNTYPFSDNEYTVYGFDSTRYYEQLSSFSNVKLNKYISRLFVSVDGDLVNTVGFDESKIKVAAYLSDGTSEKLQYSQDGVIDGYTLSENTLRDIENTKDLSTEKSIDLIVKYGSYSAFTTINIVPKKVEDFDVEVREGSSFVEGTTLDASKLAVKNLKYNDGSVSEATYTEGITVKLKSGSDKLLKGANTVVVVYEGVEKEVTINAEEKKVVKITAKLRDESKKYYAYSELTQSDFIVVAEYNNGDIDTDFKDYTLTDNILSENATQGNIQIVTVVCGNSTSLVEVNVSEVEVNFLLASYAGAEVVEGGEVDKNNVTVTVVYSDGTKRELSSNEFDLVYETIVAGKSNEVKVVLVDDSTKTTSINVIGQKVIEQDTVATPTPESPSQSTPVPPSVNTTEPEQPNQTSQTTGTPSSQAPSTDSNTTINDGQSTVPSAQIPPSTDLEPTVVPEPANTESSLSSTKYTLGVKEKVTLKLTGGKIAKVVSSNTKIATVTKKGVITAKKVGTAKIKVTDNYGVVKTVSITVKKAPKIVKANITKKILKVGKKVTLKAKFTSGFYSNSITFTSSNKKVATVNAKGVVVAKKKGKAKITLKTYNGKTVKVTITVK